jgi:hypothetical protein
MAKEPAAKPSEPDDAARAGQPPAKEAPSKREQSQIDKEDQVDRRDRLSENAGET